MVLFFSGIAPKLDQKVLQWFILVLAMAALSGGFLRALRLPFEQEAEPNRAARPRGPELS